VAGRPRARLAKAPFLGDIALDRDDVRTHWQPDPSWSPDTALAEPSKAEAARQERMKREG